MSPWMQTSTGRAFYLREPEVETGHLFTEIAPALARLPRFNGHTTVAYSVAQHSVICAEAAEDETGDRLFAAYCLLHDAHEAYLGDMTRPMAGALSDEIAHRSIEFGGAFDIGTAEGMIGEARAKTFRQAMHRLKARIDTVVADAAGLEFNGLMTYREAICRIDLRALRTERDDLMLASPQPWDQDGLVEHATRLPVRTGRIRPLDEAAAHAGFVAALQRLCPATASAAGNPTGL